MRNTLPILGVVYYTILVNIRKSISLNNDLLPKYEINKGTTTRENQKLKPLRFCKKNRIGNESAYLGAILHNQLPADLTELKGLC